MDAWFFLLSKVVKMFGTGFSSFLCVFLAKYIIPENASNGNEGIPSVTRLLACYKLVKEVSKKPDHCFLDGCENEGCQ